MTNSEFREVLEDRTTKLAIEVFKMLRELPFDVSVKVIAYQLGKSASSIGANYHESSRAESRDDFMHKISIALKEANESVYWFKVLQGLFAENQRIECLSNEVVEIRNILQSILHSAKLRPPRNPSPRNSSPHNSSPHNSSPHNSSPHNSLTHNSSPHNSSPHNSSPHNSLTHNL